MGFWEQENTVGIDIVLAQEAEVGVTQRTAVAGVVSVGVEVLVGPPPVPIEAAECLRRSDYFGLALVVEVVDALPGILETGASENQQPYRSPHGTT